jgi:uncharacterized iron-regulated protein
MSENLRCLAFAVCFLAALAYSPAAGRTQESPERCGMWIDLYSGEPIRYADMMDDLAGARVIYLGERHTLARHHELQQKIIESLAERGVELAIGLEMLPVDLQPVLNKYNAGEITFDDLARETSWEDIWDNYDQYRGPIEAGHRAGARLLALNARRELAKEVARSGLEGVGPEWASRLPRNLVTDQPAYERELLREMMVMAHATGQKDMMRRMFEAQVVKDETMAEAIARFVLSPAGRGRTVVVLCGAGHVSYGYGIPSRVERRVPGIVERIVIFSESGDIVLSEREKAMARMIEITHTELRENEVPFADYIHARSLAPEEPDSAAGPGETKTDTIIDEMH